MLLHNKFCFFVLLGFIIFGIYETSPLNTIIHENLHCCACKIVYNNCKCNITYTFYSYDEESYIALNKDDNDKTCVYQSLGGKEQSNVFILLAPYFELTFYIFIFNFILLLNSKKRNILILSFCVCGFILSINIFIIIQLLFYNKISDFYKIEKYGYSKLKSIMIIINYIILPIIPCTILCIYKFIRLIKYSWDNDNSIHEIRDIRNANELDIYNFNKDKF